MSHRFFVEGARAPGETAELNGADAHKIANVLRLRTGDEIELIDSAGRRFRASLTIQGRAVSAQLIDVQAEADEPNMRVTVAQGIPKGQKMDFVVEKLTELGAAEIVPFSSERTVSGVTSHKIDRWRRIALTAAQQCGRNGVPRIADPVDFETLLEQFTAFDAVLLPWELADRVPLRETLPGLLAGARNILVAIGPEGGFSHAEAASAESAGAHLVSLGSRILRTETAALVVLSILSYAIGV